MCNGWIEVDEQSDLQVLAPHVGNDARGLLYLLAFCETKESPKSSIKLNGGYFLLPGISTVDSVPPNDRRKPALARHTRPTEEA